MKKKNDDIVLLLLVASGITNVFKHSIKIKTAVSVEPCLQRKSIKVTTLDRN